MAAARMARKAAAVASVVGTWEPEAEEQVVVVVAAAVIVAQSGQGDEVAEAVAVATGPSIMVVTARAVPPGSVKLVANVEAAARVSAMEEEELAAARARVAVTTAVVEAAAEMAAAVLAAATTGWPTEAPKGREGMAAVVTTQVVRTGLEARPVARAAVEGAVRPRA